MSKEEKLNYVNLIFDDLKRMWLNLDISQKFGLLTLSAITLIACVYFVMKSVEPDWMVLYSDLTEPDVISVVEGLKKGGYPYKISKDKSAILVPSNMQEDLRVYVAENDLISDTNPGFELLDEMQLGSTDFKNELTKQRIFQGELTRSIERMSGIKKARVQIAQVERSVFADKDEHPSASVMLVLEPGYKLKSAQVKAIKNLVSYSIARMTPQMVFITDQNGNVLNDDVGKNSNDMESFKSNFEEQTAKKVHKVLEKIVGRGNSIVQVSADIDFNSTKATIESYIPADSSSQESHGVLTSEQTESEIYDKPTVASQSTSVVNQDNKNLNYKKHRTASNYSVSKEVKQIVYAPGSVKRMTIAVAVNKVLTAKEKEELEGLIKTASGADMNRGDAINISSLQFLSLDDDAKQKLEIDSEIKKTSQIDLIFNKVGPLAVILVLGLTSLFVIKSVIERLTAIRTYQGQQVFEEQNQIGYSNGIEDELEGNMEIESLPQLDVNLDPQLDKKKDDLTDAILSDPAEATRLLVSYIKE